MFVLILFKSRPICHPLLNLWHAFSKRIYIQHKDFEFTPVLRILMRGQSFKFKKLKDVILLQLLTYHYSATSEMSLFCSIWHVIILRHQICHYFWHQRCHYFASSMTRLFCDTGDVIILRHLRDQYLAKSKTSLFCDIWCVPK